jgi:pentose-5-phosphate-3-epimerase
VAMLNGVPYEDCSYGQKILMGVDIINTLSEREGCSVPLIVDNAESLTIKIQSNSQMIMLFADKRCEKLTVQTESRNEVHSTVSK